MDLVKLHPIFTSPNYFDAGQGCLSHMAPLPDELGLTFAEHHVQVASHAHHLTVH